MCLIDKNALYFSPVLLLGASIFNADPGGRNPKETSQGIDRFLSNQFHETNAGISLVSGHVLLIATEDISLEIGSNDLSEFRSI